MRRTMVCAVVVGILLSTFSPTAVAQSMLRPGSPEALQTIEHIFKASRESTRESDLRHRPTPLGTLEPRRGSAARCNTQTDAERRAEVWSRLLSSGVRVPTWSHRGRLPLSPHPCGCCGSAWLRACAMVVRRSARSIFAGCGKVASVWEAVSTRRHASSIQSERAFGSLESTILCTRRNGASAEPGSDCRRKTDAVSRWLPALMNTPPQHRYRFAPRHGRTPSRKGERLSGWRDQPPHELFRSSRRADNTLRILVR